MLPWLSTPADFPPVSAALNDPPGLLAVGGALTPEWLLAAYQRGIFPWFSDGQPILWWSLDPRMVLRPADFRLRRSLRQHIRQYRRDHQLAVTLNHSFQQVITACATTPRAGQPGTWITTDMQRAYGEMHALGYAHSIEVWLDGQLVGGLYGMALGGTFFGESMFAHASDASKIALLALCRWLMEQDIRLIDCQMETAHLASLGAHPMSRADFCTELASRLGSPLLPHRWPATDLLALLPD